MATINYSNITPKQFGEVQDIIGGGSCFALHQSKNILVYEAGNHSLIEDAVLFFGISSQTKKLSSIHILQEYKQSPSSRTMTG